MHILLSLSTLREKEVGSRTHPRQISRSRPRHLRKGRSIRDTGHRQEKIPRSGGFDRGAISLRDQEADPTRTGKSAVLVLLEYDSAQSRPYVDRL